MAYVSLPVPLPGMPGLLAAHPRTGEALGRLGDLLLATDEGLPRGERELIGAYVSAGNRCTYCTSMHSAVACAHPGPGAATVAAVTAAGADLSGLDLDPRLRALLQLAELVRRGGDAVTVEALDACRRAGADDRQIHDTVLIAAMFCMFNRYVDGLRTALPADEAWYRDGARRLAEHGYAAPPPAAAAPPASPEASPSPAAGASPPAAPGAGTGTTGEVSGG